MEIVGLFPTCSRNYAASQGRNREMHRSSRSAIEPQPHHSGDPDEGEPDDPGRPVKEHEHDDGGSQPEDGRDRIAGH